MNPMNHVNSQGSSALRAGAERVLDTAGDLARTKKDLVREFKTLISEGEELVRQTSTLSGDALALARDRFRDSLSGAKSRLLDLSAVARDKGHDAVVLADDYVRERPWTAVGVAAGVGLLVGAMLIRRQ